MRVHEIKELALEDFAGHISDTRKQIVELRFQMAARKLDNPGKMAEAKRRLARLLTVQAENLYLNYTPTPKKNPTKTK